VCASLCTSCPQCADCGNVQTCGEGCQGLGCVGCEGLGLKVWGFSQCEIFSSVSFSRPSASRAPCALWCMRHIAAFSRTTCLSMCAAQREGGGVREETCALGVVVSEVRRDTQRGRGRGRGRGGKGWAWLLCEVAPVWCRLCLSGACCVEREWLVPGGHVRRGCVCGECWG